MSWELTTEDKTASAAARASEAPTFVARILRAIGLDRLLPGAPRQNSTSFTIALVSLSAKLAKSDGVASRVESEAFERLHEIVHDERDNIRRMFDLAAQDAAGFDAYAHEVVRLLRQDRDLLRDVLEGLFHIAVADGILHPEEERHLKLAAETFGFDANEFRSLRGLFVHDPDDPYTILGLSPGVDNKTLKARYKQLVREHHPDQLIARGVPDEFVRFATEKLAEINGAYDRLARERAL
jgi:DnaJ like chaperone protein